MNSQLSVLNEMERPLNFDRASTDPPPAPLNNRVEALRVLATVLLREVESLEKSVPNGDAALEKRDFSLADEVERYEADMIRCALIKARGKQRLAAKILGLKFTTLNCKIKKYNINWRVIGLENEFIA